MTKRARKAQLNIRASALTIEQLDWLSQKWSASRTETLTVAIDRIYRQERGTATVTSDGKDAQNV